MSAIARRILDAAGSSRSWFRCATMRMNADARVSTAVMMVEASLRRKFVSLNRLSTRGLTVSP